MTRDARKIGFNVLLGIAFYLPLEDYVLRWLPFPSGFLVVLRQAPEVLVWTVTLAAAALHLARYGSVRIIGRRIDLFLIGFMVVAGTSTLLNATDLIVALTSLKALLRYIPLIYALILLMPDDAQLARIPRVIILAFCIQILVGLAEWLGGQPARSFFSVAHAWGGDSITGVPVDLALIFERYDVTGTFARPVVYAYFLLVGLVVWMVRYENRPRIYAAGVAAALLLTFQAHSRMAVFAAVLVVIMHQVTIHGVRKTMWMTALLLPGVAAVMLSLGTALTEDLYFLDVFTSEYQEHALTNRLGLIVYLIPNVFDGGIAMLGYSSDLSVVAVAVGEHFELPPILANVFVAIVEDVYWLALLLYFGFVGFALFALFFGKLTVLVLRLYQRSTNDLARRYALIALLLLVLSIPLNAINQTFEMRQFAYYVWLFAGVAIVSTKNAAEAVSGEAASAA